MKPISEVYPQEAATEDYTPYFRESNYQPMLESFGYEILLQVDDADYQGDSRLIFKDGDRIGYLNFGWGSCSGCDSLQSCDSLEEIEELRHSLFDQILWFPSVANALNYFLTHDWEGDYSWYHEEQKGFVEKAITLLRPSRT